jgi:hypothetical protein
VAVGCNNDVPAVSSICRINSYLYTPSKMECDEVKSGEQGGHASAPSCPIHWWRKLLFSIQSREATKRIGICLNATVDGEKLHPPPPTNLYATQIPDDNQYIYIYIII